MTQQEYSYDELRKIATSHNIEDNKVSVGIWAKLNGYFKKKRQRDNRVQTFYIKMSNNKMNNNDYEQQND